MTIQNLSTFLEVTKDMNLSKTAERLFTTQQSLSGHIRRLEKHYGVELFNRAPRLTLTNAGKLLLTEAHLIVDAENRLCEAFYTQKRVQKRIINVALSIDRLSPFIRDVLNTMANKMPDVTVNVINYAEYWGQPLLSNGTADFVITDMYTDDNMLTSEKLIDNYPCLVVSKHLLCSLASEPAEAFLEKICNGIELNDIPKQLTMACVSRCAGMHSVNMLNELSELPRIYIDPSANSLRTELCASGKAGLIVTKLFFDSNPNLKKDDILCIPLMLNSARLSAPERIYYSSRSSLTSLQKAFLEIAHSVFNAAVQ